MNYTISCHNKSISIKGSHITSNTSLSTTSTREVTLPPFEENKPKFQQYLRDKFRDTTFNRTSLFPAMSVHIHLNENAKLYACHTPIPIPFHWKEKVKESLDRDVERGIIAKVPIGTPVEWCSPVVVTAKKNGKPRRTIDLQHLNSHYSRETHHCVTFLSSLPGSTLYEENNPQCCRWISCD